MDFQHRAGGKTGTGGVASFSESNRDRRERLRQLALETIDINKVWFLHLCNKDLVVESRFIFRIHILWKTTWDRMNVNFVWRFTTTKAAIWLTLKEKSIKLICKFCLSYFSGIHTFWKRLKRYFAFEAYEYDLNTCTVNLFQSETSGEGSKRCTSSTSSRKTSRRCAKVC